MMKRFILTSALVALLVSGLTMGLFYWVQTKSQPRVKIETVDSVEARPAMFTTNAAGEVVPLDFTQVAEGVMDAVVHIRSTQQVRRSQRQNMPYGDLFERFFGPEMGPGPRDRDPRMRRGSGSGVILEENGYIVTNNHVIENADEIEVNLYDGSSYTAKVIGTDPTTDLALIKIDGKDLPTLPLADSDDVKVGEWVLAVGNPFNLTSTVTAGIVSAKGRNINILREQFAVESFIQTDAAINPGNSGGALVNLSGGLIGINTAIASPTGAYSGYGFAVPTSIVQKVVDDLIEYGTVQRGVLGVMIRTVDGRFAQDEDLRVNNGAYVDSLLDNSAAGEAGIRPGDVITEVEGINIESSPRLQEVIARYRPGDKIQVTVDRNGQSKTFEVELNNRQGTTELVETANEPILQTLGAELETIDKSEADALGIKGGVRIKRLFAGKLRRFTEVREGFIITKVDGKSVSSVEDFTNHLEKKSGGVLLEGIYEDVPGTQYYAFGL